MRVPFNDLARQMGSLGSELQSKVVSVLGSGCYVMGPEHDAFQREFADYCGVDHCVAVGNGTDALEVALRALNVDAGHEVITVANAGGYTTTATILVGATPVFADVDPVTQLATAETIEPLLSAKTKAIVVTHLYGKLAAIEPIVALAAKHGVAVVEDCAQAHGARRGGRRAGSFGHVATYSFYPTKNLGALGDGGAVLTDDDDLASTARSIRQYGWDGKYHAVVPRGRNSRLDEIQAAILRMKLPMLDCWNNRRREIVGRYAAAAKDTPLAILPAGDDSVGHLAVGLHPDRDGFRERMTTLGVDTAIHYPLPDHMQPALDHVQWRARGLEATESACSRLVTLPCFPELSESEIEYVCDCIGKLA